jgi:hypothetical protein
MAAGLGQQGAGSVHVGDYTTPLARHKFCPAQRVETKGDCGDEKRQQGLPGVAAAFLVGHRLRKDEGKAYLHYR